MPERFLLLPEVCARAGYCPNTVHNYRSRNISHRLKLPPLIMRGDGKLGCLESVLDRYLIEQYGQTGDIVPPPDDQRAAA